MLGDELVVVSVDDVVSGGRPKSLVDNETLVGKEDEVSEGVMMNGVLSRVSVVVATVGTVVSTVVSGRPHSSENCTTVTTRAATRTAPAPPAVKVAARLRYQAWLPGSLCGATGNQSRPAHARTLGER